MEQRLDALQNLNGSIYQRLDVPTAGCTNGSMNQRLNVPTARRTAEDGDADCRGYGDALLSMRVAGNISGTTARQSTAGTLPREVAELLAEQEPDRKQGTTIDLSEARYEQNR